MDPVMDTAEPVNKVGGSSGRMGENTAHALRSELKKDEKHPCSHQGQRRRKGRWCSRCWSRDSLAVCAREHSVPNVDTVLMEDSNLEQVHSEGLELLETQRTGARKKYEEEGAVDSSCFRLTTTPVPYSPALNKEEKQEESET